MPPAPSIAIDARYARAPLSGIGRHTLNLLRGLVALPDAEPLLVLVDAWTQLDPGLRDHPMLERVEVSRSPTSPLAQRRVLGVLRRRGIALLHSPDAFGPIAWPGRGGPRRVITIADVIPLRCSAQLRHTRKARFALLWRAWLRAQCLSADAVVTVSEHSARDIERELGLDARKLHVIPNSIPPVEGGGWVRPAPVVPEFAPRIVYVGRRDPYKNLEALIGAFARLRSRIPGAHLVIVGAPDPRYGEAERRTRRLGLDEAVTFTGHADDVQLERLYAGASLFAFPSAYEGFGLPPLEAMRHGVPVVASDRTAIPEVLGDAARYADPDDPDAFAGAMAEVLTNPALARALRQRGFDRLARYTPAAQARRTRELWRELLGVGCA